MAHARIIYGNPIRFYADGVEVTEERFNELFPKRSMRQINPPQVLMETSKAWPRLSDAWGVGAGQKAKAEEVYAKLGVPTEMVPDGHGGYSAKILNNEHQRKLLKATKMHNCDAGYGGIAG